MAEVFQTYTGQGVENREDLSDVIESISPLNTYFLGKLGKTTANSIRHEWLEEALPAGNSIVARAENFTPTFGNLTGIVRKANILQIISSEFKVSRSDSLVKQAGIPDRFSHEQDRAMKHWGNLAEYSIMHATLASGNASGTGRQMNGLKWQASLVSKISGVSLSEGIFNDVMADAYALDAEWDTAVVPASMKRRISGFTAGTTKWTDSTDKRLVNAVDIYESDFAVVKVVPHRYAIAGEIIFTQPGSNFISYLDRPHFEDYAKTTDGKNGLIVGELTTEVRNGYGVGYYYGML